MKFFFILTLLMRVLGLIGQTFPIDDLPITGCEGTFTDSGGSTAGYEPGEHFQTLLCPDTSQGTHIQLTFALVDLQPGDELCFFDGTDASPGSLISCASDFYNNNNFIIQATAANLSGCLTITFDSDDSDQGAGWLATIDCIPACQLIQSELLSTDPPALPPTAGWIDICPGDRVSFSGRGIYSQNDLIYHQSDLNSSFEWDFGDGTIGYGPEVNHQYREPGGYTVQLRITDQLGCKNTNFLSQRVRVAPRPAFSIADDIPEKICAGDTITLTSGIHTANAQVSASPGFAEFALERVRSDSLDLPDGDGAVYETSIAFTDFEPGQLLTDIHDLLNVCVNMEHSWMHDLEISISCPSGRRVILQNWQEIEHEVFLGVPYTDDEGANTPVPGQGFEYCWSPGTTKGSWTQFANDFHPDRLTLPAGTYQSWEGLEGLLGCPLNGDWTIRVVDRWPLDNGWIFSWGIRFNPDLYPEVESFQPSIVDFNWVSNPTVIQQSKSEIVGSPLNAGTANYLIQFTDAFGCVTDTAVNVSVLPPTHPDCYHCETLVSLEDQWVCGGEEIQLNAQGPRSIEQVIGFSSFPNKSFDKSTHSPANPLFSSVNVNSLGQLRINNPLEDIISVCIDIETSGWVSDLEASLIAPSGHLLLLTSGNGGGGRHYHNTCFTPQATLPITSAEAPFMGNFQPEEEWGQLEGAALNGDWILMLSDCCGNQDVNTLKSWSITFKIDNQLSYDWGAEATLSCMNCPSPALMPVESTTYRVSITDDYGCTVEDSTRLELIGVLDAPPIRVDNMKGGSVLFSWSLFAGATEYEVNVNQAGWIPSNGILQHLVNGLRNGDRVDLQLRVAASEQLPCGQGIGRAEINYCELELSLLDKTGVSCYNTSDGSVMLGVNTPVTDPIYILDGEIIQSHGDFLKVLAPGLHLAVVEDGPSCRDSMVFSIDQPDSIRLSFQIDPVSCSGAADGGITVQAEGGAGNYSYHWDDPIAHSLPRAEFLSVGTYQVTVTDANGCTVQGAAEIAQPPSMELILNATHNSCYGDSIGMVTAIVNGGAPDYTFHWSDGQTGPVATDLRAGKYSLSVWDANNCFVSDTIEIIQPSPLVFSAEVSPVSCFGGSDGSIALEASGGTAPYAYSLDGQSYETPELHFGLPAGQYQVFAQDQSGCTISQIIQLIEPEPFMVDAGPDHSIEAGDTVILDALYWNHSGPVQVSWLAPYSGTLCCGSALDCSEPVNCLKPLSSPKFDITYEIYAVDADGCEATDQASVRIIRERKVFVPTAFTPNGDQQNDRLLIHGKSGTVIRFFRVYDRWGELLYEAIDHQINDPETGWDGTFRGQAMSTGVYVWSLQVEHGDGTIEKLKGEVSLLR